MITLPELPGAACANMPGVTFFDPALEHLALRTCRRCAKRAACLDWALNRPEKHGVWGGTTEKQRAELAAGRSEPRTVIIEAEGHGSRATYMRGCRCQGCRTGNAQDDAIRKARRGLVDA